MLDLLDFVGVGGLVLAEEFVEQVEVDCQCTSSDRNILRLCKLPDDLVKEPKSIDAMARLSPRPFHEELDFPHDEGHYVVFVGLLPHNCN